MGLGEGLDGPFRVRSQGKLMIWTLFAATISVWRMLAPLETVTVALLGVVFETVTAKCSQIVLTRLAVTVGKKSQPTLLVPSAWALHTPSHRKVIGLQTIPSSGSQTS